MEDKTLQLNILSNKNKLTYSKNFIQTSSVYESHFHPSFEFIMVLNGKISGIVDGKKYKISKEGLLIIPPYQYHNVSVSPNSEYERIAFLFEASLIPEDIHETFINATNNSNVFFSEKITDIIKRIADSFSPPYNGEYPNFTLHLISELFYSVIMEENHYSDSKPNNNLLKITEYIDEHINEKISLDNIAKTVFLSKSTVCHHFKKTMKISVKQYILQKKIAYASSLLAEGVPAQEVAYRIGYDNYTNFYKAYKQITNRTPSNRKTNKK